MLLAKHTWVQCIRWELDHHINIVYISLKCGDPIAGIVYKELCVLVTVL